MNKTELKEFKRELKDLLKKYSVMIGCTANDGSDWYGITGEHIALSDGHDNEYNLNDYGLWLSASDL